MTNFITELSGSLIFSNDSGNIQLNPQSNALAITGGLLVSGSDIFLNGSSINTRISSLEAGSVSSGSLLPLNLFSGSTNTFTSSTLSRLSSLQAATSSYLTSAPAGTISSSAQLPSGIISSSTQLPSGTVSGSAQIKAGLPNGVVSSSNQIESLGFVTSSGDVSQLNTFTGSANSRLSSLQAATSSYVTSIPAGTISSSAQIDALGFVTSSTSDLNTFTSSANTSISALNTFTGSANISIAALNTYTGSDGVSVTALNTFTGSANTSITALNAASSSFLTSASAAALGFSSGQTTDISALNTFTGSANTRITALNTFTGSANTSITALNTFTGSANTSLSALNTFTGSASTSITSLNAASSSYLTSVPTGTISSSAQISASAAASGFSDLTYNANRVISQVHLPGFFTSSFNAGTSGSITEFLDAIFFPNTSPSITTGNQTVAEFTASGSAVVTLAGSDPEGQSLTFGTSSAYTADKFRVSGSGQLTLNALATASFNTANRGDDVLAHPIIVSATDTFNATTNKTIYIRVVPNQAPVFRETSTGGSIITSFTANRNENASTGEVTKIYFTDAESDAITIQSSSIPGNHFTITKSSTYVSIAQATASLDYETTSSYSFSISASDEHFGNGDVDSITKLPITINVTNNVNPTINNQTITGFSEDSNDGDSTKQIAATDSEGDTITFRNFTLAGLKIDSTPVSIGTYSGTSINDPHEDPFQMSSAGQITRKSSQNINSDLINSYIYSASVTDPYNTTSASAAITLTIADDVAPSITSNGTFYIIESALNGASVTTAASGIAGTAARFTVTNGQSVTWAVNPSGKFAINSSGYVTLSSNISGSNDGGETINASVTASNAFGTTTKDTFTVTVTNNSAPSVTSTPTTANLNTNGARTGNTLYTISFSDPDGDAIDYSSFTFTGSANLGANRSGTTFLITASANLSAGNYQFTSSISDTGSFDTTNAPVSFSINQAPTGSLTTNGTFYIIESALSGSNIVTNSNGRTGTQADLGVTYSPQYNSAAVQSFTSSNSAIVVNNSGNLTIGQNVSGSSSGSGNTYTSTITYRDQYDNIGTGNITVNVTANSSPAAAFSNQNANLTASVSTSTNLVSVTITDDESDTPFSMSLGGTNASSFKAVPQNANSSSYQIQAASTLSAGTYNYSASIVDNFNESASYNRSLTIVSQKGLVYGYGVKWSANPASEAQFFGSAGDTGGDGVDVYSGSLIAHLISGSIGSTFTSSYGAAANVTLLSSKSLNTLSDTGAAGVSTLGYFNFSSGGSQHVLVVFPSASNQFGKPKTMYDGVPPDSTGTAKEFYLYAKDASIPGTVASGVYYFPVENTTEGSDTWGMVFAEGKNTNNSRYFLMPDSASAP